MNQPQAIRAEPPSLISHSSRSMVKVRRPSLLPRAVRGSLHGRSGGRTVEDHAEGCCEPPDRATPQPLAPGPGHCLVIPKGVGARRGPKSGVHRAPHASTPTGGGALWADELRGRAEGCHISCCPPQLSLALRPLQGALRDGVARRPHGDRTGAAAQMFVRKYLPLAVVRPRAANTPSAGLPQSQLGRKLCAMRTEPEGI